MNIEIREEPPSALAEYGRVPIAFEVRERLAVVPREAGLGGVQLVAEQVVLPYVKDYDADPDHHPTAWPRHFDLARWGILAAYAGEERAGGAVVALGTQDLGMLDDRADLAFLWDLRVAPSRRRRGIGAELFRAAERWAMARGARTVKIETQNVNLPACRFYARQGCVLGAINRFAYPTRPDEVQLLWYKQLDRNATACSLAEAVEERSP
jgi:ribosomal protein S18 acetylase RimI-like enzyme